MLKKKMAPYIAALILLIVVILISVYKSTEAFTGKDPSSFSSFMDTISSLLAKNKKLKQTLDTSPAFDDEITPVWAEFLGFDAIPQEKPFSKALSTKLEADTLVVSGLVDAFEKAIASGSIQPTQSVADVAKNNAQVASALKILPRIVYVTSSREAYIAKKVNTAGSSTSGSSTSGSSTSGSSTSGSSTSRGSASTAASTTDASGSALNMNDLFSALTGSKEAIKASQVDDMDMRKRREKIDSVKDEAPETSAASTQEMEERIAKSVAKQLKDSLLAQRSLQNATEMDSLYSKGCPYESTATSQGQEYTQEKPASPDMSQYIRKDSIPCWNCSLP